MSFTVAIVGRPNVGKSTLFNRLVGRRQALVDDTPGLTRDRREGAAHLSDLVFTVIDTAGLEDEAPKTLEGRMREQTARAIADADVALFLIDARAGITPIDAHFASWLRTRRTPVILVANKAEGGDSGGGITEAYSLGLGEPIAISAEHNLGMGDLYAALAPYAEKSSSESERPQGNEELEDKADAEEIESPADRTLRLAVVGRPNVGKSTLVNRLLGEERMLTGPEAGITRDSIAVPLKDSPRPIVLVDTAGLRRKARVVGRLEGLSTGDTLRTIRFAQVVVLVIDATAPLEKQDLTIGRLVIEEGRALLIAVNKWDLVKDRRKVMKAIEDRLETSFPQARGLPVVPLSALSGAGVTKLLPAALRLYDLWNKRVSTAALNRWLASVEDRHPPPLTKGRRVRLRYMTQPKSRPPTFLVFASQPEGLPESYRRYLLNEIRASFGLDGVPLRLTFRGGKNPFDPKR